MKRLKLILCLLLCAGCAAKQVSPQTSTSQQAETPMMAAINNTLNWKLFETMDPAHQDDNLFFSAAGILSALAMLDLGADGSTKTEIEEALGITDLDTFIAEYQTAFNIMQEDKLISANSFWLDEHLSLADDFKKDIVPQLTETFKAEVHYVNFARDVSKIKKSINKWVNKQTKGFIKDYEASINPETLVTILNALYFEGVWQTKFTVDNTYKQPFYGKTEKEIDMMHLYESELPYYEDDKIKMVELAYEKTHKAMDILLPVNTDDKILELWQSYDAKAKEQLLSSDKSETELSVLALPKCEVDHTLNNLKSTLSQMGMSTMFSNDADFSHIAPNLCVSDIKQRAKVSIDENGTKAAAITEVNLKETSMAVEDEKEPKRFIADHPYIFVIRDTQTNVILFTGYMQAF